MQINLISILSLTVLILYLELGLFVFLKNPSAALNRWFFAVSLVFATWSFGHVVFDPGSRLYGGYPFFPFAAASTFLYLPILIRFISLLTDLPKSNRLKKWLFRLLFAIGLTLVGFMLFVPGNIERIFFIDHFSATSSFSFFIGASYAYLFVSLGLLFFLLLWWRRGMNRPAEVAQFNIIFFPLTIAFTFGIISDLILPMGGVIGLNNLSHIYSVFWLGGIAYGMLRLRFFALTPALAAEQVIGRTNQVLFFCSLQGQVTRTNSFTSDLLQMRSRHIIGRKVSSFFAEERELEKFAEWAVSKGYSGPAELSLRSAKGEYIAVNISLILVKDNFEDVVGLMVFGQDNREAIKLRNEIIIRQQIENKLRSMSEVLEARVKERSIQLANSYKELQIKMTERLKVEEKIKADIAEKEVLINEIHNRVKNNMNLIVALINAHITKGNPSKVNQKFSELAQRVRAILLVHHHLYLSINYSEVDFSGFLRMIVGQLTGFYRRKDEVEIDLNLSEIFLDIDHAVPLGIIVNEIISNSLSHAFNLRGRKKGDQLPPKLTINFYQDAGQCYLEVIDNGKGLPQKFDVNNLQTNGLPLVEVLVKDQVNGVMEIVQNAGTTVKIVFPIGESRS
ncbi:MAG: sensor histidine kinase [Bacteroidales bacterium]|nr:sensor histidine kinase [Bacteroidales bacterium]